MAAEFAVGDRVRWKDTHSGIYLNAEGTVVSVLNSPIHLEFTMYAVQFDFGIRAVFADQIEAASRV